MVRLNNRVVTAAASTGVRSVKSAPELLLDLIHQGCELRNKLMEENNPLVGNALELVDTLIQMTEVMGLPEGFGFD